MLSGRYVLTQAMINLEKWVHTIEWDGELAQGIEADKDPCETYVRDKLGVIAEGVFHCLVYDDPVGQVKLDKLQ